MHKLLFHEVCLKLQSNNMKWWEEYFTGNIIIQVPEYLNETLQINCKVRRGQDDEEHAAYIYFDSAEDLILFQMKYV